METATCIEKRHRGFSVMKWGYVGMLLLLLGGGLLPVAAQNNPYKIKDELYPSYQLATRYRTGERGLHIADTLYAKALKLNDKKAQCLALVIPTYYYIAHAEYAWLKQACNRLRVCARKNGYLQYYYFAYSQEIVFLLNQNRSMQALQIAEEMKDRAFEDEHPYGIFTSFSTAGHIYAIRMNFQMAIEQYQIALDYAKEYLPDQPLSSIYQILATNYNSVGDSQKALECAKLALKTSQSDENLVTSRQVLCQILYSMGEKEKFEECYVQCMQDVEKFGSIRPRTISELQIKHCMLRGEYEQARRMLETDSSMVELKRLNLHARICEDLKDYRGALAYFRKGRALTDSISNEMQASDMMELVAQIGNEQLKLRANELELNNTKLRLEQATTRSLYEKAESEKKALALQNRELELVRLRMESEKKELELKETKAASRHQMVSLTLVISLLSVIIAFLVIYVRRRHMSMKRMSKKNEELRVARDQAQQANKMKTVFIQNMSHEIRTPLNSIVGFSQLLSSQDVQLDNEQKQEFSTLIQHNSDLLTTLINDVLDLANLESGKYTMEMEACLCNALCEMSVSTVMHRKAEGVKLYYTSEVADDFEIWTDGNRVKQVLINFLTNAEKYTQEGEIHLHCSLSEYPGRLTFSVTDTGSGIPADKAEVVFERFKKLDEFKQGTGLGLNICRVIAERLQGEVKVDVHYTKGARFLFILPLETGSRLTTESGAGAFGPG